MDVRIIKIEGSVELAPLLGLSDAIVDIVETGSTLKENGLEVIDDVAPISARLIANVASLKLRKQEIEDLADRMEAAKSSLQRKKGGKQMIPIVKADGTVELEFIRQLKKRSGEVDEKGESGRGSNHRPGQGKRRRGR